MAPAGSTVDRAGENALGAHTSTSFAFRCCVTVEGDEARRKSPNRVKRPTYAREKTSNEVRLGRTSVDLEQR